MTEPVTVVVMGVSGAGKTTLARELARRSGWPFLDGDDLHPAANVAKMRSGLPLDDADRLPWLRAVAQWVGEQESQGQSCVVACSALRRSYRALLRTGHPSVWFVHVTVGSSVLHERLASRTGHFLPAAMLDSQLATLEPLEPGERGLVLDASQPVEVLADAVLAHLPGA